MQDIENDHPPIWHWNPSHGRSGEVGLPLSLHSETWSSLEFMPKTGVGKLEVLNIARNKDRAFPVGFEPECFFYDQSLNIERAPRPDFDLVSGGALFISRKMIDLLRGFDLAESVIFELPLFDGKEVGEGRYPTLIDGPDYDLRFPDSGGLFHLMARKMSFLPEMSKNLAGAGTTKSGIRTFSRNDYEKVPLVLSLDAETARSGADIWIETQFPSHIFCSDRLMQAMNAEGIDSPIVDYSEPATLV